MTRSPLHPPSRCRDTGTPGFLSVSSTSGPHPASVSVGSNVTYVHEVVNDTDIPAPNVVLRDSLAPGLQFVSCTRGGAACANSGNYISEPIGSLAPGASTTLT